MQRRGGDDLRVIVSSCHCLFASLQNLSLAAYLISWSRRGTLRDNINA